MKNIQSNFKIEYLQNSQSLISIHFMYIHSVYAGGIDQYINITFDLV